MKKHISALILVVITICTLLTACGGPSGTYVYVGNKAVGAMGTEIEFDGDKLTYLGMVVVTYKIDGDKIIVGDDSIGMSYSYKKEGDSIFISGDEYAKEGSDRAKENDRDDKDAVEAIATTKRENDSDNGTTIAGTTVPEEATTTIVTTTADPDDLVDLQLPIEISKSYIVKEYYDFFYINTDNQLLYTKIYSDEQPVIINENARTITTSNSAYFYITGDGTLYGWGSNSSGELGDNTGVDKGEYSSAVKILDDVAQIYTYYNTIYAITNDMALWGWGENQFPSSITEDQYVYAPVKITDNVVKMFSSSSVQKSDGSVWAWGGTVANLMKSLKKEYSGDGSYPVKITSNVIDYGTYNDEFYVLKGDNALYKITGDNTETKITDDVKKWLIYDYGKYTKILKSDGTLWAMGSNRDGELGDGTKIDRDEFVKIAENVKEIGDYEYLTNDYIRWEWDYNNPAPVEDTDHATLYNDVGSYYLSSSGGLYELNFWTGEPVLLFDNVKVPD